MPELVKTARVAIIILNYNGTVDTHACVESCLGLTYPNFRIILVDNGSQDKSYRAIVEAHPEVAPIENAENLGYAGGNNVGIRWALDHGAEFVLLLNNDVLVTPNLLTALVDEWRRLETPGSLGAKILFRDRPGIIQHLGGHVVPGPLRCEHYRDGEPDRAVPAEPLECDYNTGCALFTSAEVLQAHGLLDERYFLYWEDADFGLRLKRASLRNYCIPQAIVYHGVSASQGGGQHPLRYYYTARNSLYFSERLLPDYPLDRIKQEQRQEAARLLDTSYWLRNTAARYIELGIAHFEQGIQGRCDHVHSDYRRTREWRMRRLTHRARSAGHLVAKQATVGSAALVNRSLRTSTRLLGLGRVRKSILCLAFPTGVGDTLAITPAIHALADLNPGADIHVLGAGPSLEVLERNPHIAKFLDWKHLGEKEIGGYQGEKKTLRHHLELALYLRKLSVAKVYDFGSSSFSMGLALLSGASQMIGYRNASTSPYYQGPPDYRYTPPYEKTMVEFHLGLVASGESAEFAPGRYKTAMYPAASDVERARELTQDKAPFAVVFPHTRADNTRWLARNFTVLLRRLKDEFGLCSALVSGPDGASLVEEIEGAALRLTDCTLGTVYELLQRAAVAVTLNSGSLHVAAAAGTPLVLLNGPDSRLWLPWTQSFVEVVAANLDCRPCQSRSCWRGDVRCMLDITVDDVLLAVGQLLGNERGIDVQSP